MSETKTVEAEQNALFHVLAGDIEQIDFILKKYKECGPDDPRKPWYYRASGLAWIAMKQTEAKIQNRPVPSFNSFKAPEPRQGHRGNREIWHTLYGAIVGAMLAANKHIDIEHGDMRMVAMRMTRTLAGDLAKYGVDADIDDEAENIVNPNTDNYTGPKEYLEFMAKQKTRK
jgi:hypothetical protein